MKKITPRFAIVKPGIISVCAIAVFFAGCSVDLDNSRRLTQESEAAYQRAVEGYKRLLARNKNEVPPRLELAALYYTHGDYQNALEILKDLDDAKAKRLQAICLYKAGDYTQALSVFERAGKLPDPEYLYYYGLTCQKHNLYEQALEIFSQIKDKEYFSKAKERIAAIQGRGPGYSGSFEPRVREAVANATQEKYPLAGAVVILVDETIRLLPDNTLVSDAKYLIKILNDRGKKDYSEIVIGYDSTDETVELDYARTIKPDGEVIVVGEKDIRDVSRYLNFPLYSNARARIISMPEITEGALVEYKVRITQRQLINKKDFNTVYSLQESEPIVTARFSVRLPKGRSLKTKILNSEYNLQKFDLSPKVSESPDERIYGWEFHDIAQIELEPNMPPVSEITPLIFLSTFNSWDEIYQWWWNLAKERMASDEAITQKVNELIREKRGPEERIRALYNYCVQEIRYVGVEYGQAGYQPHYAAEIFKNKYGDCKDKAILFVTMLKVAGIEGYPVLIGTRGAPMTHEDFPAAIFNHCIAMVELEGTRIFLDITAEVCSFGDLPADDQNRRVLICKKDSYEIAVIPLLKPEQNRINYATEMSIGEDETVSARRKVEGIGQFDQAQRYWLRYTPPNLIEQGLKEKVQSMVTSGVLGSYTYENAEDLNTPIRLTYEFTGMNFLSRAGIARIFPQFAQIDTALVAKDTRVYPLEFGQPSLSESVFSLALADNLHVKYLPEKISVQSPWMEYTINYELRGRSLHITQKQVTKKQQVLKEEYPEFKKFLETLAMNADEHIIVERKNNAKAKKER